MFTKIIKSLICAACLALPVEAQDRLWYKTSDPSSVPFTFDNLFFHRGESVTFNIRVEDFTPDPTHDYTLYINTNQDSTINFIPNIEASIEGNRLVWELDSNDTLMPSGEYFIEGRATGPNSAYSVFTAQLNIEETLGLDTPPSWENAQPEEGQIFVSGQGWVDQDGQENTIHGIAVPEPATDEQLRLILDGGVFSWQNRNDIDFGPNLRIYTNKLLGAYGYDEHFVIFEFIDENSTPAYLVFGKAPNQYPIFWLVNDLDDLLVESNGRPIHFHGGAWVDGDWEVAEGHSLYAHAPEGFDTSLGAPLDVGIGHDGIFAYLRSASGGPSLDELHKPVAIKIGNSLDNVIEFHYLNALNNRTPYTKTTGIVEAAIFQFPDGSAISNNYVNSYGGTATNLNLVTDASDPLRIWDNGNFSSFHYDSILYNGSEVFSILGRNFPVQITHPEDAVNDTDLVNRRTAVAIAQANAGAPGPDSIDSTHIVDKSVTHDDIADSAIRGEHIGLDLIEAKHIKFRTITQYDIGHGQITANLLAPGILNDPEFDDIDWIDTFDIIDGQVTKHDLANDSVFANHLDDDLVNGDIVVNTLSGALEIADDVVSADNLNPNLFTGPIVLNGDYLDLLNQYLLQENAIGTNLILMVSGAGTEGLTVIDPYLESTTRVFGAKINLHGVEIQPLGETNITINGERVMLVGEGGTTNASEINVATTPTNATFASQDVEAAIVGLDSALGDVSGGLTYWTEDTGTATQAGAWLEPSFGGGWGLFIGTNGAVSSFRPDGSTYGNALGAGAVMFVGDEPPAATYVASGNKSGLFAGEDNTVSALRGAAVGGLRLHVSGSGDSFIAAGQYNEILSGSGSFIGGGLLNRVDDGGGSAAILGGYDNDVAGFASGILAGRGHVNDGNYSTIVGGGWGNTIASGVTNSSVLQGSGKTASQSNKAIIGNDLEVHGNIYIGSLGDYLTADGTNLFYHNSTGGVEQVTSM